MSLFETCWVLGGCFMTHELLKNKWWQLPSPMDTYCSRDPRHEWLVLGCASCLKAAKMCGVFLLSDNKVKERDNKKWWLQGLWAGWAWAAFPIPSLCSQAVRCCWNISWCGYGMLWGNRAGPGSASSPSQAQVSIHITWLTQNKRFLQLLSYCWAVNGVHR